MSQADGVNTVIADTVVRPTPTLQSGVVAASKSKSIEIKPPVGTAQTSVECAEAAGNQAVQEISGVGNSEHLFLRSI